MKHWRILAVAAVLASATVGLSQGLILQVNEASQVIVTKAVEELRAEGIIRTKEDALRAHVVENHRQALLTKMRDLAAYENAYRKTGNTQRISQIQQDIKAMRDLYSRLPVNTKDRSYTRAMNAYYKDISKTAIKRVQKVESSLKSYGKEVQPIYREGGSRPSSNVGQDIKGGQIGELEIYVQTYSGDVDFFINGTKITRAKQVIPVRGEGAMLITVRGKGKTYKMIQDFAGGPNTTVEKQTEDELVYSVQSGNFNGKTTWRLKEEKADFTITKQPNRNAEAHNVGEDKLKITFDGAFTIGLSVSGTSTWVQTSQRPARTVTNEVNDPFKGSITIWVTGKGG